MKLAPVGKVDDVNALDIDPVTIPICGVDRVLRKEVCEDFNFRPTLPWGNTFVLIESVEAGGAAAMAGNTIKWIRGCLLSDEERERFKEFLTHPDIEIEQTTIESIYEGLAQVYAARPTLPRTGSSGTGGLTEGTSKGASSAAASTSTDNPSQTA